MRYVCTLNMCAGCKACINVCPKDAIVIHENIDAYNSEIDEVKCISCGRCHRVCPSNTQREFRMPICWKQGWADKKTRTASSSGGAAAAIIRAFINKGGYVASCVFEDGIFRFKITNNCKEAKKFSGSKYVKSNPGTVYSEIKALLKQGQKVLFIGLPCQVCALLNFCDEKDSLYTADLICHGTPTPELLKKFLAEVGVQWDNIKDIKFRENDYFGLTNDGVKITPRRVPDSYTRAFLHSIDYTENCYSCNYARLERISDITLGDAWGQLSESVSGGVSLVMCQTQKGIELLNDTELHLEDVNLDKAAEANHQLRHPSIKHPGREKFFAEIKKGHSFRRALLTVLPQESIKQSLKMGLVKMKLLKDLPTGGGYRITIILK